MKKKTPSLPFPIERDQQEPHALYQDPAQAAALINRLAEAAAFADFQHRLQPQTRRRHQADLALFEAFLIESRLCRWPEDAYERDPGTLPIGDLAVNSQAWQHISFGIVIAFRDWMLRKGYAIGSVNVRLSTVRTYAALACQAGALPGMELKRIQAVKGYARKEEDSVNASRVTQRVGRKKSQTCAHHR